MPLDIDNLTLAQIDTLTPAEIDALLPAPAATIGFFDVLMRPNAGAIVVPTQPGMEFTAPRTRMHFDAIDNRMQFTAPANRMHFDAPEED